MPVEGAGAFGQFQRPKSWCTHIKLILLNRHNKLCVGQKENNLCRSLTYPTNQAKRSNFIDDRSSKLTNHNLLALRHYGKTTDKSVSFHQPNWYPLTDKHLGQSSSSFSRERLSKRHSTTPVPLRRPFVISFRVLNANPRTNAYFIAFIIGEHTVLTNWFIHLAIHTKTDKCYSLILIVLCYSIMITCHDYVLLWLVCIFLWETGFAFCSDICRIIDQSSPNCPKKWSGKINYRIDVVQVCLKLAGAFNETVTFRCVNTEAGCN